MPAAPLALVIVDAAPPGERAEAIAGALGDALEPLALALEGHKALRVGLHLGGALARALEDQAPALLERLVALSRRGQLELLGGARHGAFLPGIPWVDALRQLRTHQDWLSRTFGTPVRGALLPGGAWDPVLPRLLGHLGLRYALVDGRLVEAAGGPGRQAGPLSVDRDGPSLRAVAVDADLARAAALAPATLGATMRRHRATGATAHAALLPLRALDTDRIVALVSALRADPSVRAVVPWQVADRAPVARVQPVAGLPLEAACARLPVEAAGALRTDPSPWAAGPGFGAALTAFDGADRLHAAAQRAAPLVVAAGRAAARASNREAFEQAAEPLGRAQSAAPLEPGPGGALFDPAVRMAAWRDAARARAVAWRLIRRPRVQVFQPQDTTGDRPPRESVVVQTPDLVAALDPARGGALSELTLWGDHPLLNTLERPDRGPADGPALLPMLLEEEDDLPTDEEGGPPPPPAPQPPPRPSADATDRLPRLAFQDRMFGPPLSLANLRRSQPPEIGDFADGAYRVERAEAVDGGVEVVLSREGAVRPAPGIEGLVRVAKTWRFSSFAPCFSVDYALRNRSREPVKVRFGVTVNLNLDGTRGPSRVLRLPGARPVPMDAEVEQQSVDQLGLVFADAGFELLLRIHPAVTLYAYPVEVGAPPDPLAAPWAAAVPRSRLQGLSLNLVWPMDLWGEERRRVSIEVEARALAGRR